MLQKDFVSQFFVSETNRTQCRNKRVSKQLSLKESTLYCVTWYSQLVDGVFNQRIQQHTIVHCCINFSAIASYQSNIDFCSLQLHAISKTNFLQVKFNFNKSMLFAQVNISFQKLEYPILISNSSLFFDKEYQFSLIVDVSRNPLKNL